MTRRNKSTEPFDRARVEALWAKQIELGLSTTAFCAAEGLDVRAYNRWKGHLIGLRAGRLPEDEAPAPSAVPPLVDVTALLTPPASRDAGVEVILTDGIRLRLAADFDPTTLRRAVEALR